MIIFSFIIHKFTPSPPKVMKTDSSLRKQNRPPIFKTSALSQYNAFTIENKRMLVYNKTHQRPVIHIAQLNKSFYMKTDLSNMSIAIDPGTHPGLHQLQNRYFFLLLQLYSFGCFIISRCYLLFKGSLILCFNKLESPLPSDVL